jgi:hypothetical protein
LSCILEYLYKGDYFPKLEFDKRRQSWALENAGGEDRVGSAELNVQTTTGEWVRVLKDTIIYVSSCPNYIIVQ